MCTEPTHLDLDRWFVELCVQSIQTLTCQFRSSPVSCTGDSLGHSLYSFVSHSFSSSVVSNTFSVLDLYYLAFPNDKKFVKYLVYGIYIVKLVQTILTSHNSFATFGYRFGDLYALTDVHFYWLIVPIMSTISASRHAQSSAHFLTWIQLLVLDKSSMHTESSYCRSQELSQYSSSVFVAVLIIHGSLAHLLQVSLTSLVAGIIGGVYGFQAGNITKLNNRKTSTVFVVTN